MKVLITGAKGFIGSHLGNFLTDKGISVIGVDNESHPSKNQVRFSVELCDAKDSDVRGFDAIIHLAAHISVDESILKPVEYFENNVLQTVQLLDNIKKNNPHCLFIFASSAEVYGSAQYIPMTESHPLSPQSPYAETKRTCEEYCQMYKKMFDLNIKIIRNFNTFGNFQNEGNYGGVISKFIKLAKGGISLPVFGTGEQVRDYMHISYLVNFYFQALTRENFPDLIHVGSGMSVKIIDIAKTISKKFNVDIYNEPARHGEIMVLQADTSSLASIGLPSYNSFEKDFEDLLS